ncbi:MAG: hypothetical protein IAE81_07655 [Caldilineaceae bacterium]|nr:hypothetical protein [Caldilineaceae bacterium]
MALAGDARLRYGLRVLEVRFPALTDPTHPVVAGLASCHLRPRRHPYPAHIDEWVRMAAIKTAARMDALAAVRLLGMA